MADQERFYSEGNQHFHLISTRELVSDPQFQSGYLDRLAARPPRRFYYDADVGERRDTFGYERGRLTALWLLVNGSKPPKASDILGLAAAFRAAAAADAVL